MCDSGSNPCTFIDNAIKKYLPSVKVQSIKVLDFGCGEGNLVRDLSSFGYDSYGCDVTLRRKTKSEMKKSRLSMIIMEPYHLPFDDGSFDVIVSTSVLEHAQNKEECFKEIHRILKKDGYSMHLYPGKWYLPSEPHLFVPFLNMLWPYSPRWWLALWAIVGVRNDFQQEKTWREVVDLNVHYCRTGLSYWTNNRYRKLSENIFGNYSAPMKFYIDYAEGGAAKFFRNLPFKGLWGWLLGNTRMNFIVSKKTV